MIQSIKTLALLPLYGVVAHNTKTLALLPLYGVVAHNTKTLALLLLFCCCTTLGFAAQKQYSSAILTGKALAAMRDTIATDVNDYDAKSWHLHQVENNILLRANPKSVGRVQTAFCATVLVEV